MSLNRLRIAQPPSGLQRTIILDQINENASFFTPAERAYIKEEKESLGIPLWNADPKEWEQYFWKKHQNERLGNKQNLQRTLGHIGLLGSIVQYWYKAQRIFCMRRSKHLQPTLLRSNTIEKKIQENEWRNGVTKWFSNLTPLPSQSQQERTHPSLNINFENSNPPCSPHSPIASNPLNRLHSNYIRPLHRPFEPRHKPLAGTSFLSEPPASNSHQPQNQTPDQPLQKVTQVLLVRFDNPPLNATHDVLHSQNQHRPNALILNASVDSFRVMPSDQATRTPKVLKPNVPPGYKPMPRDQQDQRPRMPESLSSNGSNFAAAGSESRIIIRQQPHAVVSVGALPGANAGDSQSRHEEMLSLIQRPAGLRGEKIIGYEEPKRNEVKEVILPGIQRIEREGNESPTRSPTRSPNKRPRKIEENESPRMIRYNQPLPMDEETTHA